MRRKIVASSIIFLSSVMFFASAGFCVPVIEVDPNSLNFYAIEGERNPGPQILYIRNIGTGKLEWNIEEDCAWINVDPNDGSCIDETDEVVISVNIEGLANGDYSYPLLISDEDATNSPQVVEVNLYILGPILEVSNNYFEFFGIEGGDNPDSQLLTIYNTGYGVLNWTLEEECEWLSVSETSGAISAHQSAQVTLNVDLMDLSAGEYDCQITVSDPLAQNSPVSITVSLEVVGPGPVILMQEPLVLPGGIHIDPSGLNEIKLLWSEPLSFSDEDISITNENGQTIASITSTHNDDPNIMVIIFSEILLYDRYTITINDSVVSLSKGIPIDGDGNGIAGGDVVLVIEHRERHDSTNDNNITISDFAEFAGKWLWCRDQYYLSRIVGHWPFDNSLDDVVGGNDGLRSGYPAFEEGIIGQAVDFEGNLGNYPVTVPTTAVGAAASWTISVWEYSYAYGEGWETILGNGEGPDGWETFEFGRINCNCYVLGFWPSGDYRFTPDDLSYPRETWHFHVISYNSVAKIAKWYIDGDLFTTYNGLNINPLDPRLYIGNVLSYLQPFNGKVDDLRIFDIVLNEDDIQDLYASY